MPWPSAHVVTADEYNARQLIARRTSDAAANNTTTLANDTQLVVAATLPGPYLVHGVIWFRSTATGDFKLTLVGDGSGLLSSDIRFSTTGFTTSNLLFGAQNAVCDVADTGFKVLEIWGLAQPTAAGTLTVRWAQNASDPTGPTQVLAGSWIKLEQQQ